MAWTISHNAQAWENVQRRLHLPSRKKDILEALMLDDLARFKDWERDGRKGERPPRPDMEDYQKLPKDILVREIMDRMEEHRLCTGGGEGFHMDRTGWKTVACGPFTAEELEEETKR